MNYEQSEATFPINKQTRLTPFIVTFCQGHNMTSIDVENMIDAGLGIVRLEMEYINKKNIAKVLSLIEQAVQRFCEKNFLTHWPIALSIDLPNTCITTGIIKETLNAVRLFVEEGTIVRMTNDPKYYDQIDKNLICINDPYIIKDVEIDIEITIDHGAIVMFCTALIDEHNIECKVHRCGKLKNLVHVMFRGMKHKRSSLTKRDLKNIDLAKQFGADIITIHSVGNSKTIVNTRRQFHKDKTPLIVSTIGDQEGLDNIDDIIKESDAIILAREFLAYEINNKYKMVAIQMQVCGKCNKYGKPFYLSGHILGETMKTGKLLARDVSDVTNAILQGSGFVLQRYDNIDNVIKTMTILDGICRQVEQLSAVPNFWRALDEFPMPVTANEACMLACAVSIKLTQCHIIIIPTVTGRTAILLSRMLPEIIIITISSNPAVARKMKLFRGIVPIVCNKNHKMDWLLDMEQRVQTGLEFGLRNGFLVDGDPYLTLLKSCPTNIYSDCISYWRVRSAETARPICDLEKLRRSTSSHRSTPDIHSTVGFVEGH